MGALGLLPYPWAVSMPRHERLPAYRVLSHLVVMIAVSAVLGVVVAGLAIPFAGVAGIGARNVARTMDDLPEELEIDELSQRTTIEDADGNRLASFYDENRINVPLKGISRTMVKAVVAIEDYRFYQHGALDLKGTLRALITNQANDGVVQGGSSITQQLVKLTLLSQAKTKAEKKAATDDTYARKLKELRYAIALEQTHSKDWILERYLNTAYFGDGAFGVQAAAKHYFNVNARDLSLQQAALLAGLVKNPTGYDPTNYPDRAIERRNVVLDRMAELNVVPRDKAERNKLKDLGLDVQDVDNGCVNSRAPFFCDYVIEWLLQDPQLGETVQERRNLLKNGGLTIKTTIDVAVPGRRRQRRPGPRLRPGPGDRGPRGGRARHRQRARARAVPADGQRSQEGRDLPQLHGARGARPLEVLPGRVDVQGVHPRGRTPAGAAADHVVRLQLADDVRLRRLRHLPGRACLRLRHLRGPQLHDQRQHEHVLRHPAVGEHLLHAAGAADRRLCSLRDGPEDGGQPHQPPGGRAGQRRGADPQLHPRRRQREPTGDGRGLRHLRRPRHALQLAPGHPDPRLRPATW